MNPEQTALNSNNEAEADNEILFEVGQSVLVKRTNGDIEDGWFVNEIKKSDNKDFIQVVKPFEDTNECLMKFLPKLELQEMQKLKNDSSINEPKSSNVSEIKDLSIISEEENIRGLVSDADLLNLKLYAEYLEDKKQAQNEGDGLASIEYGQKAGQKYRALSPKAQQLASVYLSQRKNRLESER